ncbi:hypothetical protein BCR43DRAFT_39841 [Syncephalastrum racemosum]|uniref:Uncharacterized protein n=1 Tax=Syncephalastrum racemosum TaxID=13706 RepID=A0A1X2HUL3_SYNRA|nr:hypothetical protein BCR43DRAFT_39841 [Syncephalastrum racemosum]
MHLESNVFVCAYPSFTCPIPRFQFDVSFPPEMDSVELDRMAKEAHELCNYKSLSDIRIDLQKTKSVERTINRILDGGFLEGTSRDPSLSAIIIDSDEDNIDLGSTTRGENDQLSTSLRTLNRVTLIAKRVFIQNT